MKQRYERLSAIGTSAREGNVTNFVLHIYHAMAIGHFAVNKGFANSEAAKKLCQMINLVGFRYPVKNHRKALSYPTVKSDSAHVHSEVSQHAGSTQATLGDIARHIGYGT